MKLNNNVGGSAMPQAGFGFSVQDILFVLFKHKKKEYLFCGLLGLVGAATVYFIREPVYQSQAKLLVRYVVDRSAIDTEVTQINSKDSVITTEIEILNSWDLAQEVAEIIGPERILPKLDEDGEDGEKDAAEAGEKAVAGKINLAADEIRKGLAVEGTRGSNVIGLTYSHEDPQVAAEVLRELLQRYFDKHLEIHRSLGAFEFVSQQTDQVRTRLRQTEGELVTLMEGAGIMNFQDSADSLNLRIVSARLDLMAAEAALAEQVARVNILEGRSGSARGEEAEAPEGSPPAALDAAGSAPVIASENVASPDDRSAIERAAGGAPFAKPTNKEISGYEALLERLNFLRNRKLSLLAKFTHKSPVVAANDRQVEEAEAERLSLLEKFPSLLERIPMATSTGGSGNDVIAERAQLAAVSARIETLTGQLALLQQQAGTYADLGTQIGELERRKAMEEEKFAYFEATLDKARIDEALDPTKMPNISVVQQPTLALEDSGVVNKIVYGLALGGFAVGIGLAFLIELFVDRSVRRPLDLEKRLRIPVMLSIPEGGRIEQGRRPALANGSSNIDVDEEGLALLPAVRESGNGSDTSPWDEDHFIRPYAEAIHDRLVFYFELNRMAHKPKLIALAGCDEGVGTSTLAAGVAASFAAAGDGKILLVNMNPDQGSSTSRFDGTSLDSLSHMIRPGHHATQSGKVDQNLYLASVASQGHRQFAPQKLYDLLPQFQASEFDYIIFDMPPLSPTSPTIAMAGFMDKVLLVLDTEKTNRDVVKRGYESMMAGKADVSCICNRVRSRGPKWIMDHPI